MADQLIQTGVGSYDWHGNVAPPGGSHTGQSVVTMLDGTVFTVAHNRAEALRKASSGAQASNPGGWVAFDQPGTPLPLVLNAGLIASVS